MVVAIAPVQLPWDVQIDQHDALLKHAFATLNFGIYNDWAARDTTDHPATFYKLIDDLKADPRLKNVKDELDAVNANVVQSGQDTYQEFSSTVQSLSNDPNPEQAKWEAAIDAAAENAKEKAKSVIDGARDRAKKIISQLPEEVHQGATNIFISGYQTVARFFENVWAQVKAVGGVVHQFLKGTWDQLTSAWNKVQAAGKDAINWIKKIVGRSQPHTSRVLSDAQHNNQHLTEFGTPATILSKGSTQADQD